MEYTVGDILTVANREYAVPKLDCEILLSNLLELGRESLIAHPDSAVTRNQRDDFLLQCQRRMRGEPIAYILGYREFYGLPFLVDRRVLIPRPETEILVENALREIDERHALRICDVGTGSGCIAIAIASSRSNVHVTAVDISTDALLVAQRNIALHKLEARVVLRESDLLSEVSSEHFDGIVANLPYIARLDHGMIERGVVEYEPNVALFAGDDGLQVYRALFLQLSRIVNLPRWCILEIGYNQSGDVVELIHEFLPKAQIDFRNDLAGIPRICIVRF